MSYILDALKKAEAERGRGGVPGLHARQVTAPHVPGAGGRHDRLWIALVAFLVVAGLAAYLWTAQSAPSPAVTLATAPVAQPVPTFAPVTVAAPPIASAQATQPAMPPPKPVARIKASSPLPNRASVPAVVSTAKVTPASKPAATLVPLLSELPEDLRRQIPAIKITGSVYSDNPSQRLLLVNGLVLNQGGTVAAELTVVGIQQGQSEFSFRGTHFRLVH